MNTKQKFDWEKIKTEYVTTEVSQRELCAKYNISRSTLAHRSKIEDWVKEREKNRTRVVRKAVQKAVNKQANIMAKELDCLGLLEKHLNKALKDSEQFNRFIIASGIDGSFDSEERIFEKMDMRALKDAAQTLKLLEQMKRSLNGILSPDQQEQLQLARDKFELEKKKAEEAEHEDREVIIKFADPDSEGWAD